MQFKKRLGTVLVLLCCAAAGFLLYGKTQTNADKGLLSLLGSRKETIHFWYTDDTMSDYINSAAVAFGEKYHARVIPQLVSEGEYLEAINRATLQEENMPDAYLISNDSLEKAYLAGLAAQITDEENLVTTENFPQTALDAVTYQGKKVAYPLTYETSVLLYNKTYLQQWALQQALNEAESLGIQYEEDVLLKKQEEFMASAVPTTVDDILNIADTFDLPETVDGVFRWDVSDIFYNYYFVGNYMIVGGDCGDDKTKIDIYNPEAVACLEVYKALNQFFYIESEQVSYDLVIRDFLEGKLVFTIATTDVVNKLEQAVQEGVFPYEYGVALIPDPGEELKGRSLSVTGTVAINGYSKKQELAGDFAAFLAGEYAGEIYARTGKLSANIHADTDRDILSVFMEEYASSISLNKMMETGNFWIRLEVLFSKVWNGGAVEALVKELADRIGAQVSAGQS